MLCPELSKGSEQLRGQASQRRQDKEATSNVEEKRVWLIRASSLPLLSLTERQLRSDIFISSSCPEGHNWGQNHILTLCTDSMDRPVDNRLYPLAEFRPGTHNFDDIDSEAVLGPQKTDTAALQARGWGRALRQNTADGCVEVAGECMEGSSLLPDSGTGNNNTEKR